jgi:hydrogenase expression/formation protein HypE
MKMIRIEDGAGGKYMGEFLKKYVIPKFNAKVGEISLSDMEDSSDISSEMVFTTDTYVVDPPVFPGGSIGSLAVCGTANDLAVMGAKPAYMSLSLVIQEGFPLDTFEQVLDHLKQWTDVVDIKVITGDTKVVNSGIGIAINTSGIGVRNPHLEENLKVLREFREYPFQWIRDRGLSEGESIIITGNIAEHGVTIMKSRDELGFEIDVKSDVFPVWLFVKDILDVGGITAMKDPTRGGIAGVLNEIAEKSRVGMLIHEEMIPIREDVKGFCEVLGLDPLTMANEGIVVMGVVEELAEDVIRALKKTGQKNATIIGKTTSDFEEVVMETSAGTTRVIPPPTSDPIPRVC